MILVSMSLFFLMTVLMLVQALRLNEDAGLNDAVMAAFIFLLGTQAISILAIVSV